MVMINPNVMDGPIPGENFTSNTKNYPWHRPPAHADYVDIVDIAVEKILTDPEASAGALALLETGDTVLEYVTGMLRLGVSKGQIPMDQAILAAGPMAKAVETLAQISEIEYTLGFDPAPRIVTGESIRGPSTEDPDTPEEELEEDPDSFMSADTGPATSGVQDEMLGRADDEEQY